MKKEAKLMEEAINNLLRSHSKALNIPIKPVVVGWSKDSLIINGGNYSEDVEYGCGLLLAKANGKDVGCGDFVMGKERYCIRCSCSVQEASS